VYVGWLVILLWSWNWVFFPVWITSVKCRIFLQVQYWAHSISVETDYKSNYKIQFKDKQGLSTPFFMLKCNNKSRQTFFFVLGYTIRMISIDLYTRYWLQWRKCIWMCITVELFFLLSLLCQENCLEFNYLYFVLFSFTTLEVRELSTNPRISSSKK